MSQQAVIEKVDFLPGKDDDEQQQPLEHPVLVSFPRNTAPPQLGTALPTLYRAKDGSDGDGQQKQLVCRTEEMEWRGRQCGTEVPTDYFVAVYNKKRKTVELIETSAQFYMRPRLPADEHHEDDISDDDDGAKTGAQQREELMKLFGGRKSKRRMAAYRRDEKQLVRPEMAASVTEAASELLQKNINVEMQDAEGDLTSRPLAPPHNIDADTPEEAYQLEHLMSPLEFEETRTKAEAAIEQLLTLESPENPGWHPLTYLYLLRNVRDRDISADTRVKRVIACFYLNNLIAFFNGPRKISKSSNTKLRRKLDVSEDHLRCMLDRFTMKRLGDDNPARLRTGELDDRVIYYTVVVWMYIEGFKQCGHLGELAHALKMTPKELTHFAIRVGGKLQRSKTTVKNDYSKFKVNLSAPLKFPEI
eukprot:IDg13737t1